MSALNIAFWCSLSLFYLIRMYNRDLNEWKVDNSRPSKSSWNYENRNYSHGRTNPSHEFGTADSRGYYNENPAIECGLDRCSHCVYQPHAEDEWSTNCSRYPQQQFGYSLSSTPRSRTNYLWPEDTFWSKNHSSSTAIGQNLSGTSTASTSRGSANTTDSLYALQNLTGVAGQTIAPQNIRLNPPACGSSRIRPRSLIQGTVNRSTEGFCNSNSPSSQPIVVSKIPMNVVISNANIANVANIRMTNSPLTMKTELSMNQSSGPQSLMAPPFHVEPYNKSLMTTPQNVSKSFSGKPAQYNTIIVSQYQSPHQPQPSSITSTISNQLHNGNPIKSALNIAATSRPQAIVSEEESKKVKEEINRLKERFSKKLSVILESPKSCSEDEIKIWSALKNLLDNPDSISKPLSMRNVMKIEHHLLKVDQHLVKLSNKLSNGQSGESLSKTVLNSGYNKNVISNRNDNTKHGTNYDKSLIKPSTHLMPNGSCDNPNNSTGMMHNLSSLDLAFDDVCHQLQKAEKSVINKVQQKLIQLIKSKQSHYQHFLPKRAFDDLEDEHTSLENESKRVKIESIFNEKDFNLEDNEEHESLKESTAKDFMNVVDESGLLRLDLNIGCVKVDIYNIQEELHIIQPEFQVTKLEVQKYSKDWFSHDFHWEESQFFSILYQKKTLPSRVPPIILRLPVDYEDSGYTDWNLNLSLYPAHVDLFLTEVSNILTINFTDAHRNYQWSGVPIVYIISLYKRSIELAQSNYSRKKGN